MSSLAHLIETVFHELQEIEDPPHPLYQPIKPYADKWKAEADELAKGHSDYTATAIIIQLGPLKKRNTRAPRPVHDDEDEQLDWIEDSLSDYAATFAEDDCGSDELGWYDIAEIVLEVLK